MTPALEQQFIDHSALLELLSRQRERLDALEAQISSLKAQIEQRARRNRDQTI